MKSPRLLARLTALVTTGLLLIGAGALRAQSTNPQTNNTLLTSPQSVEPQATEITSDNMEMWSTDTETRGNFWGHVVVTGTNIKITCDRLEITATSLGDKTATIGKLDKFKYLLATGNVDIVQGVREATCGKAEVFPREDRVVLSVHPKVVDHEAEAVYTGDELYLYRGQRRVTGKNPQITFPPIKDLGFNKNEAAPHPDAEKKPDAATPASAGTTPGPVNSDAKPSPTPVP